MTFGHRDIPFRGRVQTRTDTFVLASVRRRGDEVVIDQTACKIDFRPVARVKVRMDARDLPRDRIRFRSSPSGGYQATSKLSWGREDLDADGNPGMTVSVDSTVCSGDLYVSNVSRTEAAGSFDRRGSFYGDAKVRISQSVLGARGVCLNVVARDTKETVKGPFAYIPVPEGTTCQSLAKQAWPVDAQWHRPQH